MASELEFSASSHVIGEVIQLSLAPAFLLVAIGSFLNVVTQRLARVIDRARRLEALCRESGEVRADPSIRDELTSLGRRIVYAQWATNFCAISALLVAVLVAILFVTDLLSANAATMLAALFTLAMIALIAALVSFMVEIVIATRTVRVRTELLNR
ncbi:MAG: DUF2721 domain-containing protein [Alphaproteobacteria bacterium]|nr:DUF2721 domain-containing protein [Alphaproteobacteria bacterium]